MMTKVLFAHDHQFWLEDEVVYSESQFSSSLWQRYLEHFDELVVFARAERKGLDVTKAEISSLENVSFVLNSSIASLAGQLFGRTEIKSALNTALQKVDAVVARLPSEFGLLAVEEAKRLGIPYVIELVGCPWDGLWNYGSLKGKLYAPIMALRVRRAVAGAKRVIYVTQEFLQRRYPNSSALSMGCSDVEIRELDKAIFDARLRRIDAISNPITLGLIGTLKTRYKGIQTVLESLTQVREQVPNIRFSVIGNGDALPWMKEAAKYGVDDIVSFDGTLPGGDAVLHWLDGVDLYLQPSFKEGLPRALIEAMSRGCPVLASKCAGIPELIDANCLIRPGDAKRLGRLIVQAVGDKAWQKEQAGRNWETAAQYAPSKLQRRRQLFWSNFADETKVSGI